MAQLILILSFLVEIKAYNIMIMISGLVNLAPIVNDYDDIFSIVFIQ